jgi:hypothetical protein
MLLGTLGVAVPIVIHLLNRYRFKVVDWGAMELLRKAVIVRARRVRIEDLILLALRCLVILLVALALARPVLAPAGGSWLGQGADVGAVIAIDASFSMGHRPGVHSRFDHALKRAREVASTLKPSSPVTLVFLGARADDRTHVKLRNVAFDSDAFESILKEAAPLPECLNLDRCLEELKTMQDELNRPVRECYLITDAQANTWSPLSDKARQLLAEMGKTGRVFCLPVTADSSENLAITRFDHKSGLLRRGAVARYEVEVVNTGTQRRQNVLASLLLNDVAIDQRVVDQLEPGQSATVSLFARFDKVGVGRLTARIGVDELAEDNVRHAVADVRAQTRILYVRAPSADGNAGDADFIQTALVPRPTEHLSVDAIAPIELPTRKFADYDIVILANVPDLLDEPLRTLFFFVKDGGGLIVFLGDNVQPAIWNARMQHDKTPLLPVELVSVEADASGWSIEPVNHPLSRVLGAIPGEMVGDARVHRHFRMKLTAGGRSVVKLAGLDEPIIAEKQLGRGRVVLFGGAAERGWTNMVVEPGLYPLLLHEAITYVGRQPHERPFTVAEPLLLPLPVKEDAAIAAVTFDQAGGQPVRLTPTRGGGQTFVELPGGPDRPGFYEIRTDPPTTTLYAALNVDPRESRVQALSDSALRDAFQGLNVRLVPQGDRVDVSVQESRVGKELWKQLLMAVLLVLLAEGVLARYFTRRVAAGRVSEGPSLTVSQVSHPPVPESALAGNSAA